MSLGVLFFWLNFNRDGTYRHAMEHEPRDSLTMEFIRGERERERG